MSIFEDFDATASRLLQKFGQPSTVRRVTYPDSDSDGKVQPTNQDFAVRAARTTAEFKDEAGSVMFAATLVIKGVDAKVGDLVYWASQWHEIKKTMPVNPSGGLLIITRVGVDLVSGQTHSAPV